MTENASETPSTYPLPEESEQYAGEYVDTPVQDDEAEQEATDAPDAD